MTRSDRIPPLSLLLGFGPALLLPLLAIAAWLLPTPAAIAAIAAGQLWGAAILIFLAGVRRGLGFALRDRWADVATSLALFAAGLGATLLRSSLAFILLALGYLAVALLDPPAARRGDAPGYFARLRPPQMAIAIAGLLGLLARVLSFHP